MKRTTGLLSAGVAVLFLLSAGYLVSFWFMPSEFMIPDSGNHNIATAALPPGPGFAEDRVPKKLDVKPIPFDGDRAIKYLKALCDLGPRVSGSDAMTAQQKLVTKHFEAHGAKVVRQEFAAKQRSRSRDVPMVNLVAKWNPDAKARVIFCAHYDTRPFASEDEARNWAKPFASANDGTSGVAFLMELAHHMTDFPTKVGVDFVLFDGEEYVFDRNDKYFFGSEHFGAEYVKHKAKLPYRYDAAILLDLFAHADARLAIEGNSWEAAAPLVDQVWKVAEAVGAKSFKYERGFRRAMAVSDDHIALNHAGIPAIDVMDFDYPDWHKITDTPDKCSAKQMEEVAKVLTAWLQLQK